MIADDDAGSRLGFSAALEAADYTATEAEDGDQALESLVDDSADLAILDLGLPGRDGMEVLRRLRDQGIEVPVAAVTAHGSIPIAMRAMELGAIGVLAKPVQAALLREMVLEKLERNAQAAGAG